MEKPMQDRMERFRAFLANNGFYVVLVVCLLLVGGASALLALSQNPDEQAEAQPEENPIVIVGQSNDQRLSEAVDAPKSTQKPQNTSVPKPSIEPITAEAVTTPAPTVKPASTTSKAAHGDLRLCDR